MKIVYLSLSHSYLSNRNQTVTMNHKCSGSEPIQLLYGVTSTDSYTDDTAVYDI